MPEQVEFEGVAKTIKLDGNDVAAIWDDGVMLSADNGNCPWLPGKSESLIRIEPGKKYKITIEEVIDSE